MAPTQLRRATDRLSVPRRPRLGIATVWFAAFWVAGVRPSLAALLGAWSVYWSLSERPQVGLEWAGFGVGPHGDVRPARGGDVPVSEPHTRDAHDPPVSYTQRMSNEAWALVFMMLVLKIPIVYLGWVVWYAIKAEPEPGVDPHESSAVEAVVAATAADGPRAASAAARTAGAAVPGRRVPPGAVESGHELAHADSPTRPVEVVAGIMAAAALFLGVLELAYRPFRLAPVALAPAARRGGDEQGAAAPDRHRRSRSSASGFVAGAALQVITHHPLLLSSSSVARRRISGVSLVQHRDELRMTSMA